MSLSIKNKLLLLLLVLPVCVYSQRGKTGDKTFADRFPADVIAPISNTSLLVKNTVNSFTFFGEVT